MLVVLLLAGCATAETYTQIDYSRAPSADWPKLREIVYDVPAVKLREYCKGTPTVGPSLVACTGYNFLEGWCAIFLVEAHPNRAALLAHERAHCAGYDHPGETFTRDAWERHKQGRR